MQTDSSARRTCMACASAVECTATVAIPISLHARWIRSAISPRFAMRTFSNIASVDQHQRFAELDGLPVADIDLRNPSRCWRRNRIHGLHRLNDEKRSIGDLIAHLDEGWRARLRGQIDGAHHGRGDDGTSLWRRRFDLGL